MDKLFTFLLDFSLESNTRKFQILYYILYCFFCVIIAIWLGNKLGFEYVGVDFSIHFLIDMFADFTILIPLWLLILVFSCSELISFMFIFFINFIFRSLEFYSIKRNIQKSEFSVISDKIAPNNSEYYSLLKNKVLAFEEEINLEDEEKNLDSSKYIKGEKYKSCLKNIKKEKKDILRIRKSFKIRGLLLLVIWFTYYAIVRVQFEELYFYQFSYLIFGFTLIFLLSRSILMFNMDKMDNKIQILRRLGFLKNTTKRQFEEY